MGRSNAIALLQVALASLLACQGSSDGAQLDKALALSKAGNFAEAMPSYRDLSSRGVAAAAVELGHMYSLGRGVPVDDALAQSWYETAERQGVQRGKSQLDASLEIAAGRGMAKDPVRAMKWLDKAVESGNPDAQRLHANHAELAKLGFESPQL